MTAKHETNKVFIPNSSIAELLAVAAEKAKMPLQKALRRASRKAFLWPEEAALMLGANGWKTLFRVTLPNIKWGLLYGLLLCNGRAIGEFGAVAVVSGHIVGLTTTMPLYIEVLYNDFNFPAAFAVASLLTLMAFVTLILKTILEWRAEQRLARGRLH